MNTVQKIANTGSSQVRSEAQGGVVVKIAAIIAVYSRSLNDRVGDFLKAGCGPCWVLVTLHNGVASPEPSSDTDIRLLITTQPPLSPASIHGHWIANARINNWLDADVIWLKLGLYLNYLMQLCKCGNGPFYHRESTCCGVSIRWPVSRHQSASAAPWLARLITRQLRPRLSCCGNKQDSL